MANPPERKEAVILRLREQPRLAHQMLFEDRHPLKTPEAHWEVIDLWHSPAPLVVIQAFRHFGKSSIAEEAILIQALFKDFRNAIILGETWDRARDRLRAIKHLIESNEYIEELFGNQIGPTWAEDKIVLRNGVVIQSFGRGQSLRGSKHLAFRPDRAFLDDIEDDESTKNEETIAKTMDWFMGVVIPALTKGATIRVNGTPLHPRALICQIAADPAWVSRVYPVRSISPETGTTALWPELYSLEEIEKMEAMHQRMGTSHKFAQEMLCRPEDPASKAFTGEMYRVEPTVRTWETTYAMVDPARTIKRANAMTGIAVWSWVGNRLIVWDAFGGHWAPDTIVAQIFAVDQKFRPAIIGVERDGLEEFLLQPLRQEQAKRGNIVPIRPVKAPKGQDDFIRSLQPFFKAGEITLAQDCGELRSQMTAFPSGRRDVLNALAYALILRPGMPVYDNFSRNNIEFDLEINPYATIHLLVNSDGRCTTAVMAQLVDGSLRLLRDWVRDGDPGTNLARILEEAGIEAGDQPFRLSAPPEHFEGHDNIGLRHAARHIPVEVYKGGPVPRGREEVRSLLERSVRGRPALRVASSARWCLNGLSGGYARDIGRGGVLGLEPKEGVYRVLMEGVESFAAFMKSGSLTSELPRNVATTADGREYLSAKARL